MFLEEFNSLDRKIDIYFTTGGVESIIKCVSNGRIDKAYKKITLIMK